MERVELFTDGACSGNPGPGGWASLVRMEKQEREISGGALKTTNNRMELTAVIEGLRVIPKNTAIDLWTDSKYVMDGVTKYLEKWIVNDWKKSDGKAVLNIDLWQELCQELNKHKINWNWVKGHDGHTENERVDKLACKERDLFKEKALTDRDSSSPVG